MFELNTQTIKCLKSKNIETLVKRVINFSAENETYKKTYDCSENVFLNYIFKTYLTGALPSPEYEFVKMWVRQIRLLPGQNS